MIEWTRPPSYLSIADYELLRLNFPCGSPGGCGAETHARGLCSGSSYLSLRVGMGSSQRPLECSVYVEDFSVLLKGPINVGNPESAEQD
jgi:hypothetical protein